MYLNQRLFSNRNSCEHLYYFCWFSKGWQSGVSPHLALSVSPWPCQRLSSCSSLSTRLGLYAEFISRVSTWIQDVYRNEMLSVSGVCAAFKFKMCFLSTDKTSAWQLVNNFCAHKRELFSYILISCIYRNSYMHCISLFRGELSEETATSLVKRCSRVVVHLKTHNPRVQELYDFLFNVVAVDLFNYKLQKVSPSHGLYDSLIIVYILIMSELSLCPHIFMSLCWHVTSLSYFTSLFAWAATGAHAVLNVFLLHSGLNHYAEIILQ